MKILYISHLHPPKNAPLKSIGGMQRVSIQLVSELQKKDDIEIKTLIQHAPWKGIEWRTALFLFKLNTTLPGIVRRFEPDVILYSSMVTASLAAMTRKRISVPMVTINHGQDVKLPVPVYQKFVPKVFKALDGVISVSEATRQECIKRGMDPEKGVALPNGFDLNGMQKKYSKQEAISALEKQFGINLEGKSLLLTVGRQVKRKGHAWFLKEVLPKIQANVIYLAIGEGPEHESLQQLVREQGLEGNVLLVGKQPDLTLQQAYTAADI
ncbi:MAG: glycosyltransferase family 4 protein, partial [Bacteroidota bacterium]